MKRKLATIGMAILCSLAWGQDTLTLAEALDIAAQQNGTIKSAYLNYEIAQANQKISYAAFLPTVTPSATRSFGYNESFSGPNQGSFDTSFTNLDISANWTLWDNGSRKLNYNQSKLSASASEFDALQTLRTTLFDVHQRYFEALRAQQLLAVAKQSVERAQKIYDQTEYGARPEIGEYAQKDVYQAKADLLNAKVNELSAQNQTDTTKAELKAILALDGELPPLEEPAKAQAEQDQVQLAPLQDVVNMALQSRADLISIRRSIAGQQLSVEAAKLNAGIQYSLDASFRHIFLEDPFQSGSLQLSASFPLYDGERSKERIHIEELSLESSRETLRQSEFTIKAQVESAYKEVEQNVLRFDAAKLALEAATVNYEAAVAAQQEGVGTLIEVLTAQVSLTTAESNMVQATYDTLISNIRLRLVTGQPIPGEK